MLGHDLVYRTDTNTSLLCPLSMAVGASTVARITGLPPVAAAFHATAGSVYEYAGTLVIATHVNSPRGVATDVHFVEPAVVCHDIGGLLVALGASLPAARLTVRCAPDVAPPAGSRLRPLGRILECDPAALSGASAQSSKNDVLVTTESTPHAITLVARIGATPDVAGSLTWCIRSDAFDRNRRAVVTAMSICNATRAADVLNTLLGHMARQVACTPAQMMRISVCDEYADDEPEIGTTTELGVGTLLQQGWRHVATLRGMQPWMRVPG
jgi:hypothetical protein